MEELVKCIVDNKYVLGSNGLAVINKESNLGDMPKNIDLIKKTEKNQLFQVKNVKEESVDYLIDDEDQLKTKFYPLVLLEYFYRLKVGGNLFIVVKPKIEAELIEFKAQVAIFLREKFRIINEIKLSQKTMIVLQKRMPNEYKEDGINNWTFGFICGAGREEWIDRVIDSIISQNVPNFEIIVCGKSKPKKASFIKYIYSDEERITTKKNIIAKNAKYENIVIIHDRVLFDKDWFNGMKKFGNMWDTIACQIRHRGLRCYDWTSMGSTRIHWSEKFLDSALLRYDDWDHYATVMGSVHIFKKSAWEKVKFNDGMYYPDFEDRLFCNEMMFAGCLLRCNPYSIAYRYTPTTVVLRKHKFNSKKLGRITAPSYKDMLVYYIYLTLFKTGLLNFFLKHWKENIYKIASKLTVK